MLSREVHQNLFSIQLSAKHFPWLGPLVLILALYSTQVLMYLMCSILICIYKNKFMSIISTFVYVVWKLNYKLDYMGEEQKCVSYYISVIITMPFFTKLSSWRNMECSIYNNDNLQKHNAIFSAIFIVT